MNEEEHYRFMAVTNILRARGAHRELMGSLWRSGDLEFAIALNELDDYQLKQLNKVYRDRARRQSPWWRRWLIR